MKAQKELGRNALKYLFIAQGVTLLPLLTELPLWLLVYWGLALGWRIQIFRGVFGYPGLVQKYAAAAVGLLGLYLSFPSIFSVECLVAFLLISFILKMIEMHSRVDAVLVVNVGFMTLATYLLFSQTVLAGVYVFFASLILVMAWVSANRERELSAGEEFRFAAGLFLRAVPLMLLLFIVMPRMGQLWQMPQTKQATTGFSDTMAPGAFGNLVESDEIAFRVSFEEGFVPPPAERYWRALVLENFDGEQWSRASISDRSAATFRYPRAPLPSWNLQVADADASLQYSIMLEPHNHRWLFTLMSPLSAQSGSLPLLFGNNVTLLSQDRVRLRAQYRVISTLNYEYSANSLEPFEENINLSLPEGNPEARRLAEKWRSESGEGSAWQEQVIGAALKNFNASFVYTLQAPPVQGDIVDAFLFSSQRGFCEHFAGSFVFLMRAAGIPARVVVGYQGGEFNPLENYLIVRQRDAHAWAEVWTPAKGWHRIDPTAAVAPSRIERGLAEAVSEEEAQLVRGFFGGSRFSGLLNWIQMSYDRASYSWYRWVLSYDDNAQTGFFERFFGGAELWRKAAFFLIACLGMAFLLGGLGRLRRGQHFKYAESKELAKVLLWLERRGYHKLPKESFSAFARRVSAVEKHWALALDGIARCYEAAAYENESFRLSSLKQAFMGLKRLGRMGPGAQG